MTARILVIDDDVNLLKSIKKILSLEGYPADILENGSEADRCLESRNYQCLLVDVKMPVVNGMDILKNVVQNFPDLPVIMISGQSHIETAVQAIKAGAYDFIEKPINPDRLIVTVKNALDRHHLQEFNQSILNELQGQYRLIGTSSALKNIFIQIREVADTQAKILIQGESGTGKELVARAIHHTSSRKEKPYIKLNCAAIPAELLESEIFGHRKGSFTGAIADRKGKFLEADEGTLFLDEIGDLGFHLQAKLLRVFDSNEVEVIGENRPRQVDVRIIAATNQNLERLIAAGKFREDLYYRLNVVKIVIPPLRERREDILPLSFHFLKEFNDAYNKQILSIAGQAQEVLTDHDWPGNVRQLRNILEKIVIFSRSNEIGYHDVIRALELETSPDRPTPAEDQADTLSLKSAIQDYEKKFLSMALQKNNWKINQTARALGIDRSNLFKKLRKYGLKT
jgi:DNA-binding NtrC family response regulator